MLHFGIVRLHQPYQVVPSHYGWPHFLVKHETGDLEMAMRR